MGNKQSNEQQVISGLKRLQEDSDVQKLYKLVDMHGDGELVPWMKFALKSGDHNILEELIETKVMQFVNQGRGKLVPIADLVKIRNKERNAMLGALRRKKGKGKSGPNILDEFNQEGANQGDLQKALKLLDGGGKGGKGNSKYREIIWELTQRGAMGENLLGVCLMQATLVHKELAKKLIKSCPKLVNDIFVSEDYYGLSPLHQAIVNEDPGMVLWLLQNGADINIRCYGAFFCPDDQKSTRTDSLEHEWVELNQKTNYTGRMYWGEYPLSFAACTNQSDCFRLLRARRADPNNRDTNGNTLLHLMVIHELPEMFDNAYRSGAKLQIANNQQLTPLTLAAKLAKKQMFEKILHYEREVLWTYGDVVCAAYPLAKIDTIDQETGEMNQDSALALIVYGETENHLELLDGLMEDLLEQKWQAFGKRKLFVSLFTFVVYFLVFLMAYLNRPFGRSLVVLTVENSQLPNIIYGWDDVSGATSDDPAAMILLNENDTIDSMASSGYFGYPQCHMWHYDIFFTNAATNTSTKFNSFFDSMQEHLAQKPALYGLDWASVLRLFGEIFTLLAVIVQLIQEFIDIKRNGIKRWWKTLSLFPAKCLYKLSFIFVIIILPARLMCGVYGSIMLSVENILAMMAVICTSVHFLFFCRGLKFVGPFVLMIYKIIAGDMLRFFLIYLIFVLGFSQAFYMIFLSCERTWVEAGCDPERPHANITCTLAAKNYTNVLNQPFESVVRMFIMSLGEFTVFYKNLNDCGMNNNPLSYVGKIMFALYELIVSILLLNLLIAMMGRTYQKIAQTQQEWKRQWAKVILMMEQTMKPRNRLIALLTYSRPVGIDKTKRAFVVKRQNTPSEQTTEKEKREEILQKWREEKRQLLKRRLQEPGGKNLARRFSMAVNKAAMKHPINAPTPLATE